MAEIGGTDVPLEYAFWERKNPPARSASGNFSNPAGSETPGRDLVKSLRLAMQARDVIAALRRIDERLTRGAAIERTDDHLNFYRAAWVIFDQLGCHAAEDRARRDFEALTGASWPWFAGALDAFGFALLPPARRHALYKMGGGVTRGDVEGWNDYSVMGGDHE